MDRFLERMYDLSAFMKELKGSFTQWYNKKQRRKGTLWEERFKSVLVEGEGEVMAVMAAYIDLNPVRAGIVKDPKDYRWRWSGYGEAVGGGKEVRVAAREGIRGAVDPGCVVEVPWRKVQAAYRKILYGGAQEVRGDEGKMRRKGVKAEVRADVERQGGELSLGQLLRCRVRYFTEGFAIGGKRFLEEVFLQRREHFGEKRKTGARKMRGGKWGEMMAMRDLRDVHLV